MKSFIDTVYFVYLNLIRGTVKVALEPTSIEGESSNPKVPELVFSGHWPASGTNVMQVDFMKIH